MKIVLVCIIPIFLSAKAFASKNAYPYDTLWYDEAGKLKDEFVVTDIFFEFAKPYMAKDTTVYSVNQIKSIYLKLDSLAKIILATDAVYEIQVHSDCRGSQNYSNNLSQKRADQIYTYLISKGIQQGKLISKGYAETKPRTIMLDNSPMQLTCEFINQLTTANKEMMEFYHQLNRRVVLKRLD